MGESYFRTMIKKIILLPFFIVLLALVFSDPSMAGYSEGAAAYKKGDFEGALRNWKPLALGGHAMAQFKLGGMYAKGKGVDKNVVMAFEWYSKAAFNGHKRASYNKAFMLFNGIGVPRDEKEAFNLFHRLAVRNNMQEAQHAVALAYAEGRGVTRNFKQAKKWFEKAALVNYLTSQLALAELLLSSSSPDHRAMGVFWNQVACIRGNSKGMKRLQYLFKNGVDEHSLKLQHENAHDWLKDSHPKSLPKFDKCLFSMQISATN